MLHSPALAGALAPKDGDTAQAGRLRQRAP